jgi:hypothetical protein
MTPTDSVTVVPNGTYDTLALTLLLLRRFGPRTSYVNPSVPLLPFSNARGFFRRRQIHARFTYE